MYLYNKLESKSPTGVDLNLDEAALHLEVHRSGRNAARKDRVWRLGKRSGLLAKFLVLSGGIYL